MNASLIRNDRSRQLLEQNLGEWWSAALGVPRVGVHDDFFFLGGDPERSALVLSRIRQDLGVEIAASELFEARTISKLSDLIEIRRSSLDTTCIIPIRKEGRKRPLFLVHGVGGNVLGFVNLVRSLPEDQPVYGIQAQALQSHAPVLIQLEAMAAYYLKELRRVQPAGPYAFMGLSFGGLVAYEMAQQLVAAGETVSLLGMLDTWQPGYMRRMGKPLPWPRRIMVRLRQVYLNTKKLSIWQKLQYAIHRLKGRIMRLIYKNIASSAEGVSLPGSMRMVRDINLMAGVRYQVRPYPGIVTLFRAEDFEHPLPEDLEWRSFALGGLEMYKLPGDHGQVLAEPNVTHLAEQLSACLAQTAESTAHVSPLRDEFELTDDDLVMTGGPSLQAASADWHEDHFGKHAARLLVDHETTIAEPSAAELNDMVTHLHYQTLESTG